MDSTLVDFFISITIAIAIIVATGYACGFLETRIIKACTRCGKTGKLQSLCYGYELYLGQQHYSKLPKRPFGVIHDHILCEECYSQAMHIGFTNYEAGAIKEHFSLKLT